MLALLNSTEKHLFLLLLKSFTQLDSKAFIFTFTEKLYSTRFQIEKGAVVPFTAVR